MNKSMMSPEFMSGALRNHKQTYSAPQTPSCGYRSLRSPTENCAPPATGSAYGPDKNPMLVWYRGGSPSATLGQHQITM